MNPNTKKLRDNAIKVSVDHYDYQILLAHAERSGVELATLVRQLAMSKIHDLMFREQPIAMILPSSNTVEMPLNHFWAWTQSPQSTTGVTSHA
ncbi:hypothetical protein R0I52_00305 [Psychrobacter sp. CAM01]|uniref:hypothetical protein n=1 Tax=Psychrobacter TaxID=497 RepID=UPI002653F791|nr:hypothetical protein [Psychrobacter sp. CAM01]MDN5665718.1 hypothetical protein [Psychrobacter sp.]MDV2859153.1 hypothetical protein [Psychrobacter sp. CAM01]